MGGRNRRKGGRKKQDRDKTPRQPTYELIAKGNLRYECYYALQGIHNEHMVDGKLVPCETDSERNAERLRWVTALKESLPASFRIGKDVPEYFQAQLSDQLSNFIQQAVTYQPDDDEIQADKRGRSSADFAALAETKSRKLPFLPFAYQLSLDRVALRRNPALKQLQTWLTTHAAEGHITRQETVSMIPPVLLNVNGNDRVLDMCAAPGSKTSQMLEDMSVSPGSKGCLVANDSNTNRAYMLSHQLRRILHHHPVALITATHAQNFPNTLTFDKILCDVPCTGDGTSRKNVDIWLKWSNGGALGLHALQLQIAKRGLDLLRVGGTMCYSTCSQNPIENEAVVAELLRSGGVELVAKEIQGFVTRPGRSTWKVMCDGKPSLRASRKDVTLNKKLDKDPDTTPDETPGLTDKTPDETPDEDPTPGTPVPDPPTKHEDEDTTPAQKDAQPPRFNPTSWKEEDLLAEAATTDLALYESYDKVPEELRRKIRATVFPPTPQEASEMHLERCIRCLPHDNNTGGFFSAVLKKVAPMTRRDRREQQQEEETPDEPETKRQKIEEDTDIKPLDESLETNAAATPADGDDKNANSKGGRRGRVLAGKDNFVKVTDEVVDSIVDFYGLSEDFPRRCLHYRALGEMKTLYYVSPQVLELFDQGIQDRITIVNTGLKAFARNAKRTDYVHGDYRVCQESIHFMAQYMTKRKISAPLSDLKQCLECIGGEKAMAIDLLSEATQAKLKDMEAGSFVMTVEGFEEQPAKKLMACMWRNKAQTVNCLVAKIEIEGMRKKIEAIEQESKQEETS